MLLVISWFLILFLGDKPYEEKQTGDTQTQPPPEFYLRFYLVSGCFKKQTNKQTSIRILNVLTATLVYTAISQQVNLVPDLCPFRSLTTV